MKTILVLTDFSINANHAAHYALKLAQTIEANLLLCNIYPVATGKTAGWNNTWAPQSGEENSIQDLGELSARLKTEIDKDQSRLFRPEINQCSQPGAVVERINEIAEKNDVVMAVLSTHNTGWLSTLLFGNHTRDIINGANFPILLIPYQLRFDNYKTIAFASCMRYTDITVLESITSLAAHMDAGILITSVVPAVKDKKAELNVFKKFFNQIPGKINYPKLTYILQSGNVIHNLTKLTRNFQIDLLVLVHRKRNFIQKIFSGSVTQQLALLVNAPQLIFPYNPAKETLTVF